MPSWLWAVIAVVLGILIYLSLRRRGGGGRHREAPAIEYLPEDDQFGDGLVDQGGHLELEGHVDRAGHVELEGQVEREGRAGDVHDRVGGNNAPESGPLSPPPPSEEPYRPASDYGPGSAVPDTAGVGPQGWTVKGNADSMLFYTADAPNYLRSAADVWFESEEAAITAGFRRWNAHHR